MSDLVGKPEDQFSRVADNIAFMCRLICDFIVCVGFKGVFLRENAQMSRVMRIPDFRLCENKGADQLCSNCTADQRLCFRYMDSSIPLLLIAKILCL